MDKEELGKLIKQLESLQIQQEAVIKKIRRVSTEEAPDPQRADQSTTPLNDKDSFRVGHKVLIKNRLGHLPLGRKASIKDRIGVVTKTTKKRVQLTTWNGAETSRAPHNLTPLSEEEYQRIVENEHHHG